MSRDDMSIDALVALYCDPEQDDASQQRVFAILQQRITIGNDDAPPAAMACAMDTTVQGLHGLEDLPPSSHLSLQQLIGRMEAPLTTTDDKTRHRATLLLAELLHVITSRHPDGADGQRSDACNAEKRAKTADGDPGQAQVSMPPAALHLFMVFFLHRLADYPSLLPSLHALSALVARFGHCLNRKYCDCEDLAVSIHRHMHVPALAQSVRSRYYSFMLLLLRKGGRALAHVQALPSALLLQLAGDIVAAGEGEKDPRCLVSYFRLLALVPRELLDLPVHALTHRHPSADNGPGSSSGNGVDGPPPPAVQAVLDTVTAALYVYFPITFRPPEGDPHGITHEGLVTGLVEALTSSRLVVPSAVPFLAAQLDAGETDFAIAQAIDAIVEISRVYGIAALSDPGSAAGAHSVDAPVMSRSSPSLARADVSGVVMGRADLGPIVKRLFSIATNSETLIGMPRA